ncbi:hypothetical protein BD770DRAFT_365945, partial [Pilaira anomala]
MLSMKMILFSFLSKLQVKKEKITCFFVLKKNKYYTKKKLVSILVASWIKLIRDFNTSFFTTLLPST